MQASRPPTCKNLCVGGLEAETSDRKYNYKLLSITMYMYFVCYSNCKYEGSGNISFSPCTCYKCCLEIVEMLLILFFHIMKIKQNITQIKKLYKH